MQSQMLSARLSQRYSNAQLLERGEHSVTLTCVDHRAHAVRTIRSGPKASVVLRDELAALLRLRKAGKPPSLPTLHGFHTEGDTMHLVLNRHDGPTVQGLLEAANPQPAQALKALHDLAQAAAFAHSQRVLILNPQPSRIGYSCVSDRFMFADLEGARALQSDEALHASEAQCSRLFASPEVLLKRGRVGPEHDAWALGVLAYWMLVGEHPFIGFYDGVYDLADAVLGNTLPSSRLPSRYRALVGGLLRKDPEERTPLSEVLGDPLLAPFR